MSHNKDSILKLEFFMLKTIKQALLLSSFAFSFVFPMSQVTRIAMARTLNQSASFRNSLAARCPLGILILLAPITTIDQIPTLHLNEEATRAGAESTDSFAEMNHQEMQYAVTDQSLSDNEFRDLLDQIEKDRSTNANKNTQGHVVDLLPNSKPAASNWQSPSSQADTIHDHKDSASNQYRNGKAASFQAAKMKATSFADAKSELSYYIAEFETIVRNKTSQIMKSCSSWSHHEVLAKKATHAQNLRVLEDKRLSFMQQSGTTHCILDADLYDLTRGSILRGVQTIKDSYEAQKALDLKSDIESTERAIRECHAIISGFEQKVQVELQEAQLAQEKQNQESSNFHEQQLKSQYDSLNFSSANCSNSVLSGRQQALSQTEKDGYASYDQEFYLSPQAAGFLETHGIDYKNFQNFYGTALQQQLHQEMCDILSQAALLQAEFPHQSHLVNSIVNVADVAHDANQLGQIQTVESLNNLGFALLEYGQAVVTGALKGCEGVAYTITHLEETAESAGKALYYVLETVALGNYIGSDDACIQLRERRKAEIIAGLENLGHTIQNSTGPQRVQALTQFAVEWYGMGKISNVVGGIMGVVESEINASKTAQGAAKIASESIIKTEEILSDVVKAAQKLTVIGEEKIAQSVAEKLLDAEKSIEMAAKAAPSYCAEGAKQWGHGLEDLLKDLVKDPTTGHKLKQFFKPGNYQNALNEFFSLKPNNVQKLPGKEGYKGILADGREINVRLESSVKLGESIKAPTIEIMNPGGKGIRIKIRYSDKL